MLQYLINKIRRWRRLRQKHIPAITIEVSRSALLKNLHALQALAPEWQAAPVLKSNAYGHGLALVADLLGKEKNIPFFCLDSYFEAMFLRNAGIVKPLLVMGHTPSGEIAKNQLKNIAFTVGSLEQFKILADEKVRQVIHLKFDTGMHRQGIAHEQVDETMDLMKHNTALQIQGILSHLADADRPPSPLTEQQIKNWNALVKKIKKNFPSIVYYHLSNSAGLDYAKEIIANTFRSGIALYGINPGNLKVKLQPALRMKSIVSEVRTIEKGETVGYNGTFIAPRETKIATVPVGYFEGIDRRLSNRGIFVIEGRPAPLAGRVSMNISSCDITGIAGARPGSSALTISDNSSDPNSIENLARLCDAIPYELLVRLPAHLRRAAVD